MGFILWVLLGGYAVMLLFACGYSLVDLYKRVKHAN